MEEKDYLQKIDELHQWLKNESTGRYEHRQLFPPDGRRFADKAEQILDLALLFQQEHHPSYFSLLPQQVGSLRNHEISSVRNSYEIANRSNARVRDKESFIQSLYKANSEIELHLDGLFRHIQEQKNKSTLI